MGIGYVQILLSTLYLYTLHSIVRPQQIRDSVVRRLLGEVCIPDISVAKAREGAWHPAHGVPEVPDGDANAVVCVEARLGRVRVHVSLPRLQGGVVGELDAHVELGESGLDAEVAEEFVRGELIIVGGGAADGVVRLQTYAVDGDATLLEILDCAAISVCISSLLLFK